MLLANRLDMRVKIAGARNVVTGSNNREDAARLVAWYDRHEFGGWFSREGRSHADVLAIFAIESSFNPAAIGDLHLADRSWGIGQMRGTTAPDFGINDPTALLDMPTGVWATMRYLEWAWSLLARRMERPPLLDEWAASYNAGVGTIINRGVTNPEYVRRWRANGGGQGG